MKLVILYRPNSEQARGVDLFIREFKATHEATHVDVLDVDTRDGTAIAALYEIMSYPAILALRDDGSLLKSWEGEALPLMDEVAYYAFS